MDSKFGNLQFLVLPTGATSGERIILDGVNGTIQIYDANGLVAQLDANQQLKIVDPITGALVRLLAATALAEVLFRPPDLASHTLQEGLVRAINLAAGGKTYPELVIFSPGVDAQNISTITLAGVPTDGSQGFIDLEPPAANGYVQVGSELRVSGDNQAAGRSLPRGSITRATSGSGTGTTTTAETKDTTFPNSGDLTFTAFTGRQYRISLMSRYNSSAALDEMEARIRDGGSSSPTTASTLLFSYPENLPAAGGAGQPSKEIVGYFNCPADIATGTHTLAVFFVRTGGVGNVSLPGSASQPKHLVVEDVGPT